MCEFCTQHGEGEKWYLEAKNYSAELINEERKRVMADVLEGIGGEGIDRFIALDKIRVSDAAAYQKLLPTIIEQQKRDHWGQVVPIEEVEQILDMSLSVVRLPCVCRGTLHGYREPRFCFGVTSPAKGTQAADMMAHPDYSSSLEELATEDAKKAFRKLDRNGLVHTVWTFGSPWIGGICNCTVTDCMALKYRMRLDLPMFFKAEYVAAIDWEECNGCRDCMKVCNFGAIGYSPSADKCSIDQQQCYGCGVCRVECIRDAITLRDRNAVPALANVW